MKLTIKKAKTLPQHQHVVVIADKLPLNSSFGLTKEEIKYIDEFSRKHEQKLITIKRTNQRIIIVLTEIAKKYPYQRENLRRAGSNISNILNRDFCKEVFIYNLSDQEKSATDLTEGIALSNYQFIHHKTTVNKEKNSLESVQVVCGKTTEKDIEELNILVYATCHARDLINEPVNHLNALDLAKDFQSLGKEAGIKVEVLHKKQIEQLKMGGLLAVNLGSIDPPTFTIMEYKPKGAINKQPVVLVGKGVVYDTGGLSLKPTPNSMDSMKSDMAGAAAVGCALYAIAKNKIPLHIIALIPATDNRPGGNAFAPGDIITMHSGAKVEMLNSDAEGRMILADALSYAKKYKPQLTIELSTLTGAAAVAIGSFGIVGMGTAEEKTFQQLKNSGENIYERVAEFPFWEEYDELLNSEIADMKSIGGNIAGAITAGKFLSRFTDFPYIHLDIAGPSFLNTREHYRIKGGTGVGVRLLYDFFKQNYTDFK